MLDHIAALLGIAFSIALILYLPEDATAGVMCLMFFGIVAIELLRHDIKRLRLYIRERIFGIID